MINSKIPRYQAIKAVMVEKESNIWYNNKSLKIKEVHQKMKTETERRITTMGKISQTEETTILATILNNPCEEAFSCECADKCDGKKCLCTASER